MLGIALMFQEQEQKWKLSLECLMVSKLRLLCFKVAFWIVISSNLRSFFEISTWWVQSSFKFQMKHSRIQNPHTRKIERKIAQSDGN
jgi:hypothetical protein